MSKNRKNIISAFAFTAIIISVVSSGLIVMRKVISGHGLDYFLTPKGGYNMNYIGELVIIGLIPIALIIGVTIKIISDKKEKKLLDDLQKKYPKLKT